MKKSIYYISAAFALATVLACSSDPAEPSQDDVDRLNKQAGSNTASVADKPTKKLITGGDWEIGKKENLEAGVITPGTYVITVAEGGTLCRWKTLRDFDGAIKSIITGDLFYSGEVARVNVKSSYVGLSLSGDCIATKKK